MLPGLAPSVPFNGDFPNVEATSTYNTVSNTTSNVVSLPSGIQIGDLLIMYFCSGGSGATHTTPSGWTLLGASGATSPRRFSGYYKIADGTEGSSVTVTVSVTGQGAAIVDRISRTGGNPEAGTIVSGINPPSVTPSWGALNNLFATFVMNAVATTGDPTNYGDAVTATATSLYLRRVLRRLNATSDDPAAFTGTSSPGIVNTFVIRPLA